MTECINCGEQRAVHCPGCVDDIKAVSRQYAEDNFLQGKEKITTMLERIRREKGCAEAVDLARRKYKECMEAKEKCLYDYGQFCGAAEYLEWIKRRTEKWLQ